MVTVHSVRNVYSTFIGIMNLDFQLFYISICLTGVSYLSFVIFTFIRDRSYVTVNCWFCNTNFKVPFKSKNEWFCEQCQQFNGFKKDGDYSRILPAQFNEVFNQKYARPPTAHWNKYTFNSNGLCNVCNANQELKVKQLAMYVPFHEEKYDEEIEIFEQKLEKSYKLCENCEKIVEKTLQRKSLTSRLSNGVPPVIDEIRASEKTFTMTNRKQYAYKCLFFVLVLGVVTAAILQVKLAAKDAAAIWSSFYSCEDMIERLRSCYDRTSNIALALCVGIFVRDIFPNWQPSIAVISSVFVLMTSEDLLPTLKNWTICVLILCSSIKYLLRNKRSRVQLTPWNMNSSRRFLSDDRMDRDEMGHVSEFEEKSTSSQSLSRDNVPLCGKFSNMSLGICNGYEPPHASNAKQSYLFKPSKILVEPSRLKMDDHYDVVDSSRTSRTVSSGYESVVNFLKKSPDVSEFDSISLVDCAIRTNNSFCGAKASSPFYYSSESSYLTNAEPCYGVSPAHLSKSSSGLPSETSRIQIDAKVPTLQIVLCSVMCFVLGYIFQTFVTAVYLR